MPSQHPEYRKLYAVFTRQAKSKTCPNSVAELFGKNKDLFRQWMENGKSVTTVALKLKQTAENSQNMDERWGYRRGMNKCGIAQSVFHERVCM